MNPKKLNITWTIATLMDVSDFDNEPESAVRVVPRFAPIIKLKAVLSEIFLVAASGIINAVVVLLECTIAVLDSPERKVLYLLDSFAESKNLLS